jgi:hypothetical protein
MSRYSLFFFIGILTISVISGCFVVGIGNKSSWQSDKIYRQLNRSIKTEISLHSSNFLIPLPCFFILLDKRGYFLTNEIYFKQNVFNVEIDTVIYKISDNQNNEFLGSPLRNFGSQYLRLDTSNCYWYKWATTDTKNTLKLPYKFINDSLFIEYKIYFKNIEKPLIERKELHQLKPNWIWINSFF